MNALSMHQAQRTDPLLILAAARPTRFARGLIGQHAAGGWITCPECKGVGRTPDPWRFGVDAKGAPVDPSYVAPCPVCRLNGRVWDHYRDEDPLLVLARKRAERRTNWMARLAYEGARHDATFPVVSRLRRCDTNRAMAGMLALSAACVERVADRFCVSLWTVRDVISGKNWGHLA